MKIKKTIKEKLEKMGYEVKNIDHPHPYWYAVGIKVGDGKELSEEEKSKIQYELADEADCEDLLVTVYDANSFWIAEDGTVSETPARGILEKKRLIERGYFALVWAKNEYGNYRDLHFFETESEVRDFLYSHFIHSQGKGILDLPLKEILDNGYVYLDSEGMFPVHIHVRVFHDHMTGLYLNIDDCKLDMFDPWGRRILLPELFEVAETIDEINMLVEVYNKYWE